MYIGEPILSSHSYISISVYTVWRVNCLFKFCKISILYYVCNVCVCVCLCCIDVGIFDFLETVTTPKIMYRFSSNRNLNQILVPHKNPKNPVLSSEFIESVQSNSPHDEAEQVLSMSDNDKKTKKLYYHFT